MMNTSFDELYTYFKDNTKVDSLDLPSTVEGQVNLIINGIREFNIRLRLNDTPLTADTDLELLSEELSNGDFIFLSECMSLAIYKNMKTDFLSTWEVFQNDVGRKYYKDQLSGRENLVREQEERLCKLKLALCDNFDDSEV